LLLEEFVSSKLEGSLKEVTSGSWTETSPDGTSTFACDDLSETANHTLVVCERIELDSGLDAVTFIVSS